MIYQNLEELKAALLIEPDLKFKPEMLGENLYQVYIHKKQMHIDYVQMEQRKIIELVTKEDVLKFLDHPSYYFDYNPKCKEFRADK